MREVPPSCGEHAGLNCRGRVKAFEDFEQKMVGQRADSVFVFACATSAIFTSDDLQKRVKLVGSKQGQKPYLQFSMGKVSSNSIKISSKD